MNNNNDKRFKGIYKNLRKRTADNKLNFKLNPEWELKAYNDDGTPVVILTKQVHEALQKVGNKRVKELQSLATTRKVMCYIMSIALMVMWIALYVS